MGRRGFLFANRLGAPEPCGSSFRPMAAAQWIDPELDAAEPPRLWKFAVCIGAFAIVFALLAGADPRQRWVAATFAFAVASWITEAIPLAMTALLSTTMLVGSGTMKSAEAFAAYGDQIVLLFIGSFIIARAMEDSGLDRRISFFLLSKPGATRSASSILFTLGFIACLISLFVSNTATTAMLLPIGRTILRAMNAESRGHPVATSILLMLTWGSSVAVGTIIGTPPNVIGVGLIRGATDVNINFVQWGLFAMPITVVMLAAAWLHLRYWRGFALPNTREAKEYAVEESAKLGPLRDSEKATIAAFFVALFFWVLPGTLEYAIGSEAAKPFLERIPEAVAAILGAAVLFVLPCRDTPVRRAMTWQSAAKIEWGTILLFAGGIALGKAVFESGLAKSAGDWLAQTTHADNLWAITAISIAMSIALSELASNTASATTMTPVAIALAQGASVSPIPPALGAVLGSNLGFMLPISTGPNAIVYSSGLVPPGVMLRAGILFDILGFGVTFAALRLILPLLGLA